MFFLAFVFYRGRLTLRLDSIDVQCKELVIFPNSFKDNFGLFGNIYVIATVNYYNFSGTFVHDAAVAWTESVSTKGFTMCALKAGRLDRKTPDSGLTFVDYFVFQGAPSGSVSGKTKMSDWWEGTTCKKVNLPLVGLKYAIPIKICFRTLCILAMIKEELFVLHLNSCSSL